VSIQYHLPVRPKRTAINPDVRVLLGGGRWRRERRAMAERESIRDMYS
jgi:hypothetical protein